jgi:hypothetical protein
LETTAVFDRKISDLEPTDCVIEKVVRLSGAEFDRFAGSMLEERDFIRDNNQLMRVDSEDKAHCLLVVGDGRRDGILVNSEGASYARYSALLPNADTFLMTARYPSLTELVRNLTAAADHIVALGSEPYPEGAIVDNPNSYSVQLGYLSKMFGIPLGNYGGMTDTLCTMLHDRPEIARASFNSDELLVDLASDGKERGTKLDAHRAPVAAQTRPSVVAKIRISKTAPKQPRNGVADRTRKDDTEL